MGAAAAVVLIKERHIVEAMERLGIITPGNARTLEQLEDMGVDSNGLPWRALKNRVVVREASPGQYYLDVEVWQATRRRRRRVILLVLAAALIMAAVTLLTGNRTTPQ
jgi:hypothetical protein